MDPQQAPLTRADLDQAVAAIIAAVRSDLEGLRTRIDGVEQALTTRIDGVEQALTTRLEGVEQALIGRVHAAERAGAANLSDVRSELIERINIQDRRMERVDINIGAILTQLSGIHRAMTTAEQADLATAGTLAAMRRTIDDLARRVEELEKRKAG